MIEVIDNFLDESDYIKFRNDITDVTFPWYYVSNVSAPEGMFSVDDINCKEGDGFFNTIYNHGIMENAKNIVHIFEPFFPYLTKLGYKPEDLLCMRLSMKLPKEGYTEHTYQIPHIDTQEKHDVLIYYVNDSDGDTRIFNEYHEKDYPKLFTVKQRISPVGNRLIKFDGFQYHTASYPIETPRRIVINFNMRKNNAHT